MIDREKVIKGLEQFIADFKPFCGNKSDWQRVDDALALLKDSGQDEGWLCEKRTTSDDYQWFDNRGELIRCKDCKFWDGDDLNDNDCECSCNGGWWFPEDYCSHGERREGDEG